MNRVELIFQAAMVAAQERPPELVVPLEQNRSLDINDPFQASAAWVSGPLRSCLLFGE
jgi:hypothetical protein